MGVLADFLTSSIPAGEIEFPVSHYSRNGRWDWEKIQCVVPSEICDRLAALRPPSAGQSNFPCWSLTSTGDFSLKMRSWKIQIPSSIKCGGGRAPIGIGLSCGS